MILAGADLAVLGFFLAAVLGLGLGLGLARKGRDADRYMGAGRSLPGWALGLSIFGSYVSSISFLANPGKAYADDWGPLVFSFATIPATWIAARWIVPYYRREGSVSAYGPLERRFGPWARTYSAGCFLLTQVFRTGTILYLLARAFAPVTGWPLWTVIAGLGAAMTLVTLWGGLEAAVWTGVLQSAVLVAGAVAALIAIVAAVPGGAADVVRVGAAHGKFSLGSLAPDLAAPTFWATLVYGLVINLQNFAMDQSFIQRTTAARSDREAARSLAYVPLAYLPAAAAFFFAGTALFALAQARPEAIPSGLAPDAVFPHFIANGLAPGLRGLVLAGIVAAAMDPNLNAMATLTLEDLWLRRIRPAAGERERLLVLRGAVVGWGVAGTLAGLAMTRARVALDLWYEIAGVCAGGMLGLFLLGRLTSAGRAAAAVAVAAGVAVILGLTFGPRWAGTPSPLHSLWTVAAGTAAILGTGALLSRWRPAA